MAIIIARYNLERARQRITASAHRKHGDPPRHPHQQPRLIRPRHALARGAGEESSCFHDFAHPCGWAILAEFEFSHLNG
jgi:hypothetical protein